MRAPCTSAVMATLKEVERQTIVVVAVVSFVIAITFNQVSLNPQMCLYNN